MNAIVEKRIGQNIRALRENARMTQDVLAIIRVAFSCKNHKTCSQSPIGR